MPLHEGEVGKAALHRKLQKKQRLNIFKRLQRWAERMDKKIAGKF